MKLEIKLDDPKYCNGCPCFDNVLICKVFRRFVYAKEYFVWNCKYVRPQECIEKNGE